MEASYHEEWILVNKIPTHVITWGCHVKDLKKDGEVVYVLGGNPGITTFYIGFLSKLYHIINIPILIASYAGHEVAPANFIDQHKSEAYPKNQMYTLKDQINHTANILNEYISSGSKVYIISHSVGTYISLKLLERPEIVEKIKKCYSLFPMMEQMEQTDNAWIVKRMNNFILSVFEWITTVLLWLPEVIQYYLVYLATMIIQKSWSPPKYLIEAVLMVVHPSVFRNVYYMAFDEMKTIHELDTKVIEKYTEKFKFYYGTTDGWCPIKFCEKLRKNVDKVDCIIDDQGIEHSFILKYSELMADIVGEWYESEFKQSKPKT